jgi:two-component system response regulator PilR (NtrC family)
MKFLLVEDDPSHTILMSSQLTGFGAEVLCTNTVGGAKQMIGTQSPFDLVVLDQDLPDGMGFDVQQHLRESSAPPPVIFVTADDTAEHAVRAMKQGARGYVIKRPNYLIELISEVSRILSTDGTVAARNRSEYEMRERARLTEALERNQWNVSATARDLRMGRGKLRGKLAMLGIDA